MKKLLPLIFCLSSLVLMGQVTSVDYLMEYNCEMNQYDVKIEILEGSATSLSLRAQFNSQISVVVPTGEEVIITDLYMPLENNQNYTSSTPIIWRLGNPIISPAAQPENDFYGITPNLAPPGFYNDLQQNDIVTLFSFTAGSSGVYDESVRFFDAAIDPPSSASGMGGGDFRNGFTIGGSSQIYNGYSVQSCVTNVNERLAEAANVYPNPFQEQFSIEVPSDSRSLYVLGLDGKVYYQTTISNQRVITINSVYYPSGVHFVRFANENGITSTRKIMKL